MLEITIHQDLNKTLQTSENKLVTNELSLTLPNLSLKQTEVELLLYYNNNIIIIIIKKLLSFL